MTPEPAEIARGLSDLVRSYLDACFAVEKEAHRARQPGANAWSSAPVVGMICLRDDLCRAVGVELFTERTLALSARTTPPEDAPAPAPEGDG